MTIQGHVTTTLHLTMSLETAALVLAILEDPSVRLRWETGYTQAHKEAVEGLVRALREAGMRQGG